MNDFLQSIRNGSYAKDNGNSSKPRYNNGTNGQRPRRPYEPNGNYTRNGNERKFRPRTGVEGFASDDNTMTTIKDTLQAILANQETALAVAERKAIADERKAEAFEFIAQHIGKLLGENFVPKTAPFVADVQAAKPEIEVMDMSHHEEEPMTEETERVITVRKPDVQSTQSMDKDDILGIISSMRREGSTYNEIATHLDSLNLPTFSGRGKWHAQTIHRLCQAV
jgi:hypothetical protein